MRKPSERAFTKAYDDYADEIFRFAVFQTGDRDKALDILQDTFTRTWAYLQAGNEIGNLRAFLYKTARNLSINDAARSKAYSLEEMQDMSGFDPEDKEGDSPETLAEHAVLLSRMSELEPQVQELLTLRYMNGLAVREIGEILGLAPNTVSVRIHRAVQDLKKKMHIP